MKKYKVRFERTLLSEKTDTLLKGFEPFYSRKTAFTSKFAMFKNPKLKRNFAYYIDTCRNHFNLQSEVMNDLTSVFGIKNTSAFRVRDQNEWSVMLNAEEVIFTGMDNSRNLLEPFADYDKTLIVCYYNNSTKGKIYAVMNFEQELETYDNDFMKALMELSFYPHAPSQGMEPGLIIQSGSNNTIYAIASSASGRLLAYGGEEGAIKITNGDGSRELRTIQAYAETIHNLEFSHNERLLVSCSDDSVIKIWEVETGKLVAELRGHKESVNDIAFFDRDQKLLSSSSDSTIKVWDLAQKRCIKTMRFNNKVAQIELEYAEMTAVINMLKGRIKVLNLIDYTSEDIESGYDKITDLAMPYSNAIVVSSGKAVKYIYTPSKKERIISTEKDSAYRWFVPIMKRDSSNNMNLLLLTEHGYGKIYDYESHSFIRSFRYQNFDAQQYFSLGYNYQYNMAIYGGSTYCTTYAVNTGEFTFIMGTGAIPYDADADGANEVFKIGFKDFFSIVSLKSGRVIWNSNAEKVPVKRLSVLNRSTGNVAFLDPENYLISYDYRQNKSIYKAKPDAVPVYFLPLPDDSSFIYLTDEKEILLHQAGMAKDKSLIKGYGLKELNLLRDTFLLFQERENACLKNIFNGKTTVIGQLNLENWYDVLAESREYFALRSMDTVIHIYNKRTFKKTDEISCKGSASNIQWFCLNPVKDEVAISGLDGEINITRFGTHESVKKWKPHIGYLWRPKYTPDGRFLVTPGTDAFVRLWETGNNYSLVTSTYSGQYGCYITVSPEKYYVASVSFAKEPNPNMAYYSYGNTFFDLADLDIEFNRPDIISKALGYESGEIIGAYQKLYEKRLKRLHLDNSSALKKKNRPVLRSVSNYPPEVTRSDLRLFFVLHDDHKKLKSIKITINDVPVREVGGEEIIDGIKLSEYNSTPIATTIYLSKGLNKVSVKVTNEDDVESYPYTFSTWYSNPENKVKPKLHIIGIGVSKFKESQYNLKYPAKDVRDIIRLFQNQKNMYSSIIVDTLLNDSATLKNILKLKEKILNDHKEDSVGVNDKVMIFAATHGLLDKNLDYYLATYDVNFENPSQNGLLYSEIEGILDHISPRNKVVLIDACHSGEIDKDEVVVTKSEPVAESGSIAFRSTSSSKISSGEGILKNSMNLMKEMFIDLRKTSGATVISSAGGTEYAIEGEEWNNGVFSYSLINALRKHKADVNGDNKVYLSELQRYIEVDVPAITHGKQQPTSRSENISNDVLIWRNDFNEELAGAIKVNDKELVDKLIKEGADVASTDSNGATTLMWAVMYSDLEMVKKLVNKKADLKAKGAIYIDPLNPVYYYGSLTAIAAAKNKMDILKYLLEEKKININEREYNPSAKSNDGWPPIAYAVSEGNKEMLTYLLSRGADINMFVDPVSQEGLEHMAFSRDNLEICQLLVAKGVKYKRKDKRGNTIITRSTPGKNLEMLKLALQLDKEAVNDFSSDSLYPVLLTAFTGKTEFLKEFQKAGANMKVATNGGQTIVHLAARQDNLETLREALLIYPGALNLPDKQGFTPLISAALDKHPLTAQYLCEHGADLSLKDSYGSTFEDYAKSMDDKEMLQLVQKYKK
ncbi:MAG: ankyrin repeat domain-containing protein [Bacteroidia bacterium]